MSTKSEREFLHDLASPISTAILVTDMMAEAGNVAHLEQLKKALRQVETLLQARREFLKKQEESGR